GVSDYAFAGHSTVTGRSRRSATSRLRGAAGWLDVPPFPPMLSFSTCWNSGRHKDGEEMLREIVVCGISGVELVNGTRRSLVEGILRSFDKGVRTFSSLHNFCPLPVEITRASPDCYKFSSPDDRERERALRQTFQTIDFADRLGAK